MNFIKRQIITAGALALVLCAQAFGQQPAAQNAGVVDTFVTHTSFKNRVFEIKHRDPDSLISVVNLLTSGHKGSSVSANRAFKTITIRDFPENIASVEDALKRLDTPEAPRPDIELRMHVLLATNAGGATNSPPADLKDVLTQLQSTLNYKSYQLLTTIVQRTKESLRPDSNYLQGQGSARMAASGGEESRDYGYHYGANSVALTSIATGTMTVQLGSFQFDIRGTGDTATIRSDVGIREGEQVVVGTSSLKDKALILVISAKLIK